MLPMGNQFVPLLSPSKPAAATMSRSDSVAEHRPAPAPVFTPLDSGPTAPAVPEPPSPCSAPAHAGPSPQISFKRDGDLIMQIQVQCSCGESIVLDCDYAADPRNPAGRV